MTLTTQCGSGHLHRISRSDQVCCSSVHFIRRVQDVRANLRQLVPHVSQTVGNGVERSADIGNVAAHSIHTCRHTREWSGASDRDTGNKTHPADDRKVDPPGLRGDCGNADTVQCVHDELQCGNYRTEQGPCRSHASPDGTQRGIKLLTGPKHLGKFAQLTGGLRELGPRGFLLLSCDNHFVAEYCWIEWHERNVGFPCARASSFLQQAHDKRRILPQMEGF